MTLALKAMVEAMAAEIARQAEIDDRGHGFYEPETYALDGNEDPRVIIDAWIDLEKVARAGLAAIPVDVLARAIYALDPQTEPGDPDEPNEPLNGVRTLSWDECDTVYCEAASSEAKAILDAILKETP
jgi:hypothetical protein